MEKRKQKTTNYLFFAFLFFAFSSTLPSSFFSQTPEQVQYYSERIKFGTEDVKRNALFELRNFKSADASRIALPALKDASEIIRATATHTVVFLPKDESAQALLPLLNEKSDFIRKETAYALGKTRNPQVANELIRILQKDKKLEVRNAAAVALGKVGNPSAVQHLASILAKKPKESRKFLRRAAARSIGQIAETIQNKDLTFSTPNDFLPPEFKRSETQNNMNLSDQLPVFRQAVPVLLNAIQNKKEFTDTKREIAFALGVIGDKSTVTILQEKLNDEDYYLAEIAKEALRKITK